MGCIHSTYIPIRAPANKNKFSYLNHQQQISITLQGISDPNGAFLDVFTGPPSKIHDARVYKLSFVYKRLPDLCSGDLHLVGGEAFPLSNHLLTPYREQNGQSCINYNNSLHLSRQPVEKAIRLLKQRFRQLSRLDFHQVDTTAKFMISCCVLHNLCTSADDTLIDDGDLQTDPFESETANHINAHLYSEFFEPIEQSPEELQTQQMGELKRNRISTDLWTKLNLTIQS